MDHAHRALAVAHGARAGDVDQHRIAPGDEQAGVARRRRQRPLAFAGDDAVDEREVAALRAVGHAPVAVGVEQHLVEIEHRPPDGVVALPAPFHDVAVEEAVLRAPLGQARRPRDERMIEWERKAL